MRRARVGWFALVMLAACSAPPAASRHDAREVRREVERIARDTSLWPGFEPLTIPMALFDGDETYLFGHPSPPAAFRVIDGAHRYDGRFAGVVANNHTDVGGVVTATVLLDGAPTATATELAAVALHEAFHVFQRAEHPSWQANEGDLFVYPVDDAALLALRRLETEALRRSLAAGDDSGARCWAMAALTARRQRFERLDEPFVAYERSTELNEGLAEYIELSALGGTGVDYPDGGFDAVDVRGRAYTVGATLALLLERFSAEWRESLEAGDGQYLDVKLELLFRGGEAEACSFSEAERRTVERSAREDAGAVVERRHEVRRRFDQKRGVRIVIEAADGSPLWPEGFDPLNVERVEGAVVHSRFVNLGNDMATLEVIGSGAGRIDVLTEGVGPHPLFQGIRRVVIVTAAAPHVDARENGASIRGDGIAIDVDDGSVTSSEQRMFVRLGH